MVTAGASLVFIVIFTKLVNQKIFINNLFPQTLKIILLHTYHVCVISFEKMLQNNNDLKKTFSPFVNDEYVDKWEFIGEYHEREQWWHRPRYMSSDNY